MAVEEFSFRAATAEDMPAISTVRLSVVENAMTREELDRRGITNESVAASFLADSRGWVAEHDSRVVAFSIADRATRSVFALFVLPGFEGRGLGRRLLDQALGWLRENGVDHVWLTTSPGTRAASFYDKQGWMRTGMTDAGEIRFERRWDVSSSKDPAEN